jgi:hypothetical protein
VPDRWLDEIRKSVAGTLLDLAEPKLVQPCDGEAAVHPQALSSPPITTAGIGRCAVSDTLPGTISDDMNAADTGATEPGQPLL